jgi:hypothetical protein
MSKAKAARGALEALVDAYKRTFDPETYYHTTPMGKLEGDKFDPNFSLEDDGGLGATYFTKDKGYANEVAEHWKLQDPELDYTEITTYPVKIKTKDLFDYKNQKHIEKLSREINLSPEEFLGITNGDPYLFEIDDIQNALKKLGFRGYHIDEPGSVGLFNPDKGDVRSIFAKFDPAKSKSGNILASVPAAGLVALGGAGALSNLTDE